MTRKESEAFRDVSGVRVIEINGVGRDIVVSGNLVGDRYMIEAAAVLPKEYVQQCVEKLMGLDFEKVRQLTLAFRENGVVISCREAGLRTSDKQVDVESFVEISKRCCSAVEYFVREVLEYCDVQTD